PGPAHQDLRRGTRTRPGPAPGTGARTAGGSADGDGVTTARGSAAMNTPLRRVAMAVMAMIVALLLNATYIQVIKADDYRADPRNARVRLDEYSRQRGQISAGGAVLASSVETDDRYKYLRVYPTDPAAFAPVTGFYSMQYGSTGLERAEDPVLNGSDAQLFGSRLVDLVSGRDPRGGNVVTTIDPMMQQVAYNELTSKGYTGSVVAIEPSTGKIL